MAGAVGEQRASDRFAYQALSQLFFNFEPIHGDIRLAYAPTTGDFLPPLDVWLKGAWKLGPYMPGLWLRYANYAISPLYSAGPFVTMYLGAFEVQPGYLLVLRGPTRRGETGQIGHTVFVRSRWEYASRSALLLWSYLGQEAVFNNRTLRAADESGLSLVVGWERWMSPRWGLRAMATVTTAFELEEDIVDLMVAVKGRL
jgi:hypothetical protein